MSSRTEEASLPDRCDLLVIGAGLAGVSAALRVKCTSPLSQVILVESERDLPETGWSEALPPGATVFFTKALRAGDLLVRGHLPSHGNHEWFAASDLDPLAAMSSVGCQETARAFHVDVPRLRSSLLTRARAAGVVVSLGTRVKRTELTWPESRVRLANTLGTRDLDARWIIDGSGVEACLAREHGLLQELGTTGSWVAGANWTGTLRLDSLELVAPKDSSCWRPREFATHDFCLPHGRVSLRPHVGGGTSAILTLDRAAEESRPHRGTPLESYSHWVRTMPGVREVLAQARLESSSFRATRQIDWTVSRVCARGWFLVGDSAGRRSTSSSSSLNRLAEDVWIAADLIAAELNGDSSEVEILERLHRHDQAARARATVEAPEAGEQSAPLRADAILQAAASCMDIAAESWHLRRAELAADQLPRGSRLTPWLGALRGTVLSRLRRLAQLRLDSGLRGTHNRRWHPTVRANGTLLPLTTTLAFWMRAEFAGLRHAMTPVRNDSHVTSTAEISQRAARALETARGSAASPQVAPPRA